MRENKARGIKHALFVMAAAVAPLMAIGTASAAMAPMTPHPSGVPDTSHGQCVAIQAQDGGRVDGGLRGAAAARGMTVRDFQNYLWVEFAMMDCGMMM